jgi:hypothetical protein|uniref:Uncharacterized protein n=1 Tax=Picea glauca TaxID=3330 RepID=A0A117NFJ3_PICGL|nr:hypothetical protein ABT39_MTgene3426 [Picea glauca]
MYFSKIEIKSHQGQRILINPFSFSPDDPEPPQAKVDRAWPGWNYDHEIASAAGGWDFSLSNRTPPMNVAKYGDG